MKGPKLTVQSCSFFKLGFPLKRSSILPTNTFCWSLRFTPAAVLISTVSILRLVVLGRLKLALVLELVLISAFFCASAAFEGVVDGVDILKWRYGLVFLVLQIVGRSVERMNCVFAVFETCTAFECIDRFQMELICTS